MRLGVLVLAAGKSSRFGGDKLTTLIFGKSMLCRSLGIASFVRAERYCVTVSRDEVRNMAVAEGFEPLWNTEAEEGIASSVRLGVQAMQDLDAILFLVADMPRLLPSSLERLVSAHDKGRPPASCLCDGDYYGNPAIFSAECFDRLLQLSGDRGGKRILTDLGDRILRVPCSFTGELADVDTKEELMCLELRR